MRTERGRELYALRLSAERVEGQPGSRVSNRGGLRRETASAFESPREFCQPLQVALGELQGGKEARLFHREGLSRLR